MTNIQALATIFIIAGCTLATRALPFALFPADRRTPSYIVYLGRTLPCAIMGMLVIYCLKDVSVTAAPHGLPELIAITSTLGLHLWRRNTLLSIAAGTALYMALTRLVFA